MSQIKLCKDCKHHTAILSDWCNALVTESTNLVTGKVEKSGHHYCEILRDYGFRCGPEGKLWEPKPSLWQRIQLMFKKEIE